jgi:hypothetical protein
MTDCAIIIIMRFKTWIGLTESHFPANNFAQLLRDSIGKKIPTDILFPNNAVVFFHATGPHVINKIFSEGLLCWKLDGLQSTAIGVPKNVDEAIGLMSRPHKGFTMLAIIHLPNDQVMKSRAKWRQEVNEKGWSEDGDWTSFFVNSIPLRPGSSADFDAVLPPKYIVGAVDLTTGTFIPKGSNSNAAKQPPSSQQFSVSATLKKAGLSPKVISNTEIEVSPQFLIQIRNNKLLVINRRNGSCVATIDPTMPAQEAESRLLKAVTR